MTGLRQRQGNLRFGFKLFNYLSLTLVKPRIRLGDLKTRFRIPYLGLNPIIDSINLILKNHSLKRKMTNWYKEFTERKRHSKYH